MRSLRASDLENPPVVPATAAAGGPAPRAPGGVAQDAGKKQVPFSNGHAHRQFEETGKLNERLVKRSRGN